MADGADGGGTPPGTGEGSGCGDEGAGAVPEAFGYGPPRPCPDCRGGGKVLLLTSSTPCGRCGGSGLERAAPGVVCYRYDPSAPEAGAGGAGAWHAAEFTRTETDDAGNVVAVVRERYDASGRCVGVSREAPGEGGAVVYTYDPSAAAAAAGPADAAQAPWLAARGTSLWVGYDARGRQAWRVEGGPDGPRGGLVPPAAGSTRCPACGDDGRAPLPARAEPCEVCGGTGRPEGGAAGAG